MGSRVFTRFFYDLTYWPCFWPDMIHIQSWPILMKIGPKLWPSCVFTRFFYDSTYWPSFWPDIIHIQSWLSLINISPKLLSPECSQDFSMIWPTDLVFDLAWPIFELDWNTVKMIILSKFDEDWTWTLISKVFTKFFFDLIYWPSFWPDMIHIRSWPSFMKIGPKLWPLECSKGFSMIWSADLVFDQT